MPCMKSSRFSMECSWAPEQHCQSPGTLCQPIWSFVYIAHAWALALLQVDWNAFLHVVCGGTVSGYPGGCFREDFPPKKEGATPPPKKTLLKDTSNLSCAENPDLKYLMQTRAWLQPLYGLKHCIGRCTNSKSVTIIPCSKVQFHHTWPAFHVWVQAVNALLSGV